MKRLSILVSVFVLVAALGTGIALASGHRATLKLRKTSLGKVLVNGHGFTLYMFAADRRDKDNCVRRPGCTHVWPPLVSTGKPVGKTGVKQSLLGTIKLPNGTRQVTYAGHPVYTYVADSAPGQTFGEGVTQSGAKWYVLNGAGKVVKKK